MRQMWFGLLAIAAGTGIYSAGCGDTVEPTGSTSAGGGAATSSASSTASAGGASSTSTSTSTASSTTSASGSGGAGGATASSSAASTSGTGGGCATPAECPKPATQCQTATCIQGVCGLDNVPAQTPTSTQTLGDCQTAVCDGQGAVTSSVNDSDVPADNEQCTADTCAAGVPSHTPLASGTVCSEGTGKLCDAAGKCVECLVGSDCATGLCSAGVCSTINGCGPAMATDLTAVASTTINFGGNFGFKYAPKCIKVKVGSKVVLDGVTVGAFGMHPFVGGEVKAGVKVQAVSGPFIPITNSAALSSKTFTMTAAGTYPYYCDFHALNGMTGVVFVVP